MSKHYSLSFKLNAVDMVLNHGFGVRETAQLCDMPCLSTARSMVETFCQTRY